MKSLRDRLGNLTHPSDRGDVLNELDKTIAEIEEMGALYSDMWTNIISRKNVLKALGGKND